MKAEGQVAVEVRCSMEQRVIGRFELNNGVGPVVLDWSMFTHSFIPAEQCYMMVGQAPRIGTYALCPKCKGKLEVTGADVSVGNPDAQRAGKLTTKTQARANAIKAAETANQNDKRHRISDKDKRGGAHSYIEGRAGNESTAFIVVGATKIEVK